MKKLTLQLSIGQYVCFGICLLLMMVIPISRDRRLFGIDLNGDSDERVETLSTASDGTVTVNTTEIGKDIIGYAGPTPVEIQIKDGRIAKITPLPNRETPEFYGAVRNSDLLESLDGMTLREASEARIDAVSGATYSSAAIIRNIKAGVSYVLAQGDAAFETSAENAPLGIKWYATLAIVLCGAILPLVLKNKKYRYVQLALNVVILGFWGGTFVSYSIMVSALTNGMARMVLIPTALLIIVAFVYPMFGRPDHYCTWLCPYGSLQDLAGKCLPWKIPVSASVAKYLGIFRRVLWFALMWLLWTGLWFDWMGYEPFAAFFFNDASWAVLAVAAVFIVLSLFIPRPYCRFVCPTGSLFKFAEGRK